MKAIFFVLFLFPINSFCQLTDAYVDKSSQTSMQIIERQGIKKLFTASAFLINVRNHLYLITNNHVAGEEFARNEHLNRFKTNLPNDSIPNNFLVKCYTNVYGQYSENEIRIRKKSGDFVGIKFWDNDKDSSTLLDIVAIPVLPGELPGKLTWYDSSYLNSSINLYPGLDVFVVGFPSDSGIVYPLPIWKRGTIASEPDLINVGSSRFYIDATTRGGMSGSPVVFRGNSAVDKSGDVVTMISTTGGIPTLLIGIYSAQQYNLELGVVTRLDKIYTKLKDMNP